MDPELHPHLTDLAALLGTWQGQGSGAYPGSADFTYLEEVVIGHAGRPFLTYAQRTRSIDDGTPLHSEVGYLRVPTPGACELVLAHPVGATEIAEGTTRFLLDGSLVIEVRSTHIGLTSTAKEVAELARRWRLVPGEIAGAAGGETTSGDVLEYTVEMAAVGQPLQHHLRAELRRVT